MTVSPPVPNAAVTGEGMFAIPFERASRVLPSVLASALGGELRERGDGDFVVARAIQNEGVHEVIVRLERDGSETRCRIRIDTPFAWSTLALEAERVRQQARVVAIKAVALLAVIALFVVACALVLAARTRVAPILIIAPSWMFIGIPRLAGRLASRRFEATMEKKAARIRAAAGAREAIVARALRAIDEHIAAQGGAPGYRVAAYEVAAEDDADEHRAAHGRAKITR